MGKYPPNRNNVFREEKLQKSPAVSKKGENTAKSIPTNCEMSATTRSPSNEILAGSAKGEVTASSSSKGEVPAAKPSSNSNRIASISSPASLQLTPTPGNDLYKPDSDTKN